jgi:hypothetical protein
MSHPIEPRDAIRISAHASALDSASIAAATADPGHEPVA